MKILFISLIIRLLMEAFRAQTDEPVEIDFEGDDTNGLVIHPAEYLLRWE